MAHERSPVTVAIADGRVVDVGSHDRLMAAKDSCHDLCMTGSEVAQRPPAVVAVQHQAHRGMPGAVAAC